MSISPVCKATDECGIYGQISRGAFVPPGSLRTQSKQHANENWFVVEIQALPFKTHILVKFCHPTLEGYNIWNTLGQFDIYIMFAVHLLLIAI